MNHLVDLKVVRGEEIEPYLLDIANLRISLFKNYPYLSTGYSKEDIDKPDWILDIVGKRADFS